MSHYPGEPITGILRSTDASAGVQVPIFSLGSTTARTLEPDEYIEIRELSIVTAAGGDSYLFLGPDATLGTGETVRRGDFSANGGIQAEGLYFTGQPGALPFVLTPAGNADVNFSGCIRKVSLGERPDYKESEVPG